MNWSLKLKPSADREFRSLDEGPKRDVAELMQDLREDPFSIPDTIQLRSHPPGTMRTRFHHGYRMVYFISKPERMVYILRIRPRPIAYKGMRH